MDNQQPSINKYILQKKPKKQHGFIYCYTSPSGKKYVGQTLQSLEKRAKTDGRGYKQCVIFWKAIQKYGFENFQVQILEEPEIELLDEKEKEWIAFLDTQAPRGYNISGGGGGYSKKIYQYSCDGGYLQEFNSLTDAAKAIGKRGIQPISDCLHKKYQTGYGYIWDFEKYDRVNPQNYIPNNPKEIHAYDLDGNYLQSYSSLSEAGRIVGANHNDIKKVAEGKFNFVKGRQWSFEKVDKMKPIKSTSNGGIPVCQIDIETGRIVNIYASCQEAARALGVNSSSNIVRCVQKKGKTYHGYRWEIYEGSTTTFLRNPVGKMEHEK